MISFTGTKMVIKPHCPNHQDRPVGIKGDLCAWCKIQVTEHRRHREYGPTVRILAVKVVVIVFLVASAASVVLWIVEWLR